MYVGEEVVQAQVQQQHQIRNDSSQPSQAKYIQYLKIFKLNSLTQLC